MKGISQHGTKPDTQVGGSGKNPSEQNVEIEGTEPYIVGGHTASGYWVNTERETTIHGLYAAGDVAGGCPQKYVTGAMVEGEIAASFDAEIKREQVADTAASDEKERRLKNKIAEYDHFSLKGPGIYRRGTRGSHAEGHGQLCRRYQHITSSTKSSLPWRRKNKSSVELEKDLRQRICMSLCLYMSLKKAYRVPDCDSTSGCEKGDTLAQLCGESGLSGQE